MPGFGKTLVSTARKSTYQIVDETGKVYMTCDNKMDADKHQVSMEILLSRKLEVKELHLI